MTTTIKQYTRAEWKEARKLVGDHPTIGSSESAAALGVSRWESPLMLYAKKTGAVSDEIEETEAMRTGRDLQNAVIAGAIRRMTAESDPPQFWGCADISMEYPSADLLGLIEWEPFLRSRKYPWMVATLDSVIFNVVTLQRFPTEAKTTSIYLAEDWEDGAIPPEALAQIKHALIVSGFRRGMVCGLIGGQEIVYRWVDHPSPEEEAAIVSGLQKFRQCVIDGTPPDLDGSPATMRALKILHPEDDGRTVDMTQQCADWHKEFLEAKDAEKQAERRVEELKTLLMGYLGSASFGRLPNGEKLSLLTTKRAGYEVKPTSFRELRTVGAKAKARKK